MKIGIIGAGRIGGNLTKRFTELGHEVSVTNSRGPETLAELANQTGATAVQVEQAASGAEVLVLAVPFQNISDLPDGVLDGLGPESVVIDTANYPRQRDWKIDDIDNGMTSSGWVANQLNHPVVKVFNSILALALLTEGKPPGTPGRIALPVAGDDQTAKAVVIGLVDQLGFDGVDAGTIDNSWRQQPGTPVYLTDLNIDGVKRALLDLHQYRTL